MYNIDLTPIIQAIICLLALLITKRLIPWIKARTTTAQQECFHALVRVLVYAAEQIYGAGNGQQKFDYVCDRLRDKGYEVDRAAIEAEVYMAFKEATLRPDNIISERDDTVDIVDGVDVEITHWTLEQLRAFCADNGVPAEGAQTREDFINAIERWGKVTDEPPTKAAEGREE